MGFLEISNVFFLQVNFLNILRALTTWSKVTVSMASHARTSASKKTTRRGTSGVGFQSVLLNFLPAPNRMKWTPGGRPKRLCKRSTIMQNKTDTNAASHCSDQIGEPAVVHHKNNDHNVTNAYLETKVRKKIKKNLCIKKLAQGPGDLINPSTSGGPSPILTSVIVLPSSIHSPYSLGGKLQA